MQKHDQSSEPREIEAKYTIADPACFTTLLGLTHVGPFVCIPAATAVLQRNQYYDTADLRLQAALHGFRIRVTDAAIIATLKGPSIAAGMARSRTEWEQALTTADPQALPESQLRTQLLALTDGAPLLQRLTITTHRWVVHVLRDGQELLEMALDNALIEAGSRTQKLCELELELRPAGSLADMEAMAMLLQQYCQLTPESRAKLERGLLLLEGRI